MLNKIRTKKWPYFGLRDNDKVRYITMLRMGLIPLRAHKFSYGFSDTSDPFCLVCESTEDTEHYLLHCKSYILSRATLFQNISLIFNVDISTLPKRTLVSILLYDKEGMAVEQNHYILHSLADYIKIYIYIFKRLDTT